MFLTLLSCYIYYLTIVRSSVISQEIRIDCHPSPGATEEICLSKSCLWIPTQIRGAPYCIFDNLDPSKYAGYDAVSFQINGPIRLERRNTPSLYGDDYQDLWYSSRHVDEGILRLQIGPDQQSRDKDFQYDVKQNLNRLSQINSAYSTTNKNFEIIHENSPFGIKIVNKSDPTDFIFDTTQIPGFTFSKQFIQLTTRVPTQNVYGIGEQYHTEFRRNFNYNRLSLFAHDNGPRTPGLNIYGFHPFYMGLTVNNMSYGVYLHSTHAMDVFFQPDPDLITFRIIGGVIDLFFFLGPTPGDVIEQYTRLIGRPMMPPYWSLGFHLCRYGYRNLTYLKDVWNRNRAAGIPQDVQFIDIDYMDGLKDFTYDSMDRYKGLKQFIKKEVHGSGRKFVPIIDPAIAAQSDRPYPPLTVGLDKNVFIVDNRTGQAFKGKVWPGNAYWPDFTNPEAVIYWKEMMQEFHKLLPYDGVWLDMNDPSNFVSGAVSPPGCANNSLNNPPYMPTPYSPIYYNTVCLDAKQHAGTHYELHNYYGYYETLATSEGLSEVFPGKRPFILTRSTSPGSGKYAAHWSGDNESKWSQLRHSLISLIEFNMFGIPFIGADICGFGQDTTEELCLRWSQVGAFYPYSRNHNDIDSNVDQDPGVWPSETANAIKNIFLQRYSLLPHLYTLFYQAHRQGSTVIRPMVFEWPADSNTWNMDDQILWGSGLMIAPILCPNSTQRDVYFPKELWYNVNDGYAAVGMEGYVTATIPKDSIGLFLRGGHVIPYQSPGLSTTESRLNLFGLVVAPDSEGKANGTLFWDDGDSVDSISGRRFCFIRFLLTSQVNEGGELLVESVASGCPQIPSLENITIAGVAKRPIAVTIGRRLITESVDYDPENLTLIVKRLAIRLKNRTTSLSWTLEN